MTIEKHDLRTDFPLYIDEIHDLKMNDDHFLRLFNQYGDCDLEVKKIEEGIENTSDEYVEQLKLKRLNLKDELYRLLKKQKETA